MKGAQPVIAAVCLTQIKSPGSREFYSAKNLQPAAMGRAGARHRQRTMTRKMADTISVALVGSGGAGVITAGTILLEAAAKAGWYGLMTRSLGPQIRGGESAALLRLSVTPVETHADAFDLLVAIDWKNFDRLADEIPLKPDALVISDAAGEGIPKAAAKGTHAGFTLEPAAAAERVNMLAVGLAGGVLGLPEAILRETVTRVLESKGHEAVEGALRAIRRGIEFIAAKGLLRPLAPPRTNGHGRWLLSGNQADRKSVV